MSLATFNPIFQLECTSGLITSEDSFNHLIHIFFKLSLRISKFCFWSDTYYNHSTLSTYLSCHVLPKSIQDETASGMLYFSDIWQQNLSESSFHSLHITWCLGTSFGFQLTYVWISIGLKNDNCRLKVLHNLGNSGFEVNSLLDQTELIRLFLLIDSYSYLHNFIFLNGMWIKFFF